MHAVSDGREWTITPEADRDSYAQKNREGSPLTPNASGRRTKGRLPRYARRWDRPPSAPLAFGWRQPRLGNRPRHWALGAPANVAAALGSGEFGWQPCCPPPERSASRACA